MFVDGLFQTMRQYSPLQEATKCLMETGEYLLPPNVPLQLQIYASLFTTGTVRGKNQDASKRQFLRAGLPPQAWTLLVWIYLVFFYWGFRQVV